MARHLQPLWMNLGPGFAGESGVGVGCADTSRTFPVNPALTMLADFRLTMLDFES
jgi:hypothetical protein